LQKDGAATVHEVVPDTAPAAAPAPSGTNRDRRCWHAARLRPRSCIKAVPPPWP